MEPEAVESIIASLSIEQLRKALKVVAELAPHQFRTAVKTAVSGREPCIHPGVFATGNPTEFCRTCQQYIPMQFL
jgi:hypothetical protein